MKRKTATTTPIIANQHNASPIKALVGFMGGYGSGVSMEEILA